MMIDRDVITEVRETLGDDGFRAFVGRLIKEADETLEALKRFLGQGDLEALARAAHRTSGSAASIGAKGLHAALKDIENASRQPDAAGRLPALLDQLPERITETALAMDALMNGGP